MARASTYSLDIDDGQHLDDQTSLFLDEHGNLIEFTGNAIYHERPSRSPIKNSDQESVGTGSSSPLFATIGEGESTLYDNYETINNYQVMSPPNFRAPPPPPPTANQDLNPVCGDDLIANPVGLCPESHAKVNSVNQGHPGHGDELSGEQVTKPCECYATVNDAVKKSPTTYAIKSISRPKIPPPPPPPTRLNPARDVNPHVNPVRDLNNASSSNTEVNSAKSQTQTGSSSISQNTGARSDLLPRPTKQFVKKWF